MVWPRAGSQSCWATQRKFGLYELIKVKYADVIGEEIAYLYRTSCCLHVRIYIVGAFRRHCSVTVRSCQAQDSNRSRIRQHLPKGGAQEEHQRHLQGSGDPVDATDPLHHDEVHLLRVHHGAVVQVATIYHDLHRYTGSSAVVHLRRCEGGFGHPPPTATGDARQRGDQAGGQLKWVTVVFN